MKIFENCRKIFELNFFRGMHLWMDADHRLINLFPSDQKHSTRNCIKLADVEYLALIVHSRGEKKVNSFMSPQNQGNEHQHNKKKLNSVKSH